MNNSLTSKIKTILIDELNLQDRKPEDIADDATLFGEGLELDSLDALQLAVALEEHFGIKIPEGDEARDIFKNVGSIAAFIERNSKPSP